LEDFPNESATAAALLPRRNTFPNPVGRVCTLGDTCPAKPLRCGHRATRASWHSWTAGRYRQTGTYTHATYRRCKCRGRSDGLAGFSPGERL